MSVSLEDAVDDKAGTDQCARQATREPPMLGAKLQPDTDEKVGYPRDRPLRPADCELVAVQPAWSDVRDST